MEEKEQEAAAPAPVEPKGPPVSKVQTTEAEDRSAPDASPSPPAGSPPKGAAAGGASPRTLAKTPAGRGGTAGIFAGVAVIAPVLIRELSLRSEPFLLLPVTMIALAVALAGFRVAQGGRDGKLGRIGLMVAVLGTLILTVMFTIMAYLDVVQNTRLQSGTWLLQFGFFALLAGILLFGGASLVAGAISRGPVLLMMASLVLGVLLDMVGAFPGFRFRWGPDIILGQGMHYGLKVFGLSLIWLGYTILKDNKAKAAASARSA